MSDPPNPSAANEEARMRRALGLRDDDRPRENSLNRPGAQRPGEHPVPQRREADRRVRRFVKDGEVPVVLLSGSRDHAHDAPAPVNRLAAAESAVDAERTARERAERSLQEALTTVQHLQTQVAHANLAHTEALAAERHAREAAEQARAEAVVACDLLQAQVRALEQAAAKERRDDEAKPTAEPQVVKPLVRRTAAKPRPPVEGREPQPVKWWLPSYRAKKKRGS